MDSPVTAPISINSRNILLKAEDIVKASFEKISEDTFRKISQQIRNSIGIEIERRTPETADFGKLSGEDLAKMCMKNSCEKDGSVPSGTCYDRKHESLMNAMKSIYNGYKGTDIEEVREKLKVGTPNVYTQRANEYRGLNLLLHPDEYVIFFGVYGQEVQYRDRNSSGTRIYYYHGPIITNYGNLYHVGVGGPSSNSSYPSYGVGYTYEPGNPNIRLNDILIQLIQSFKTRDGPYYFKNDGGIGILSFHKTLCTLLPRYWGSTGFGSHSIGIEREREMYCEQKTHIAELEKEIQQRDNYIKQLESRITGLENQLSNLKLFQECMDKLKESMMADTRT